MAKRAVNTGRDEVVLDLGKLNPKQQELFNSTTKFTCYGGAKAGGKSHGVRVLADWLAWQYPGIKILFLRETFDDIRQNQIEPNLLMLPPAMVSYNGANHKLTFYNGSTIQYGNWAGNESERKYQGKEYDIIMIDEATQFTESMFRHLGGCLRGNVGKGFPKRMFLTCNPGGVGHFWVKRLFIDRRFKVDLEHPEKSEKPEEYSFIFAKAEDNVAMLEENESYLEDISKMAESDAMRYGDWNIMSGQYFDNFDENIHVVKSFPIPPHWEMYRSFDYGLDKFACFWWAVDTDGRCWCIRSLEAENKNVQDAAKLALDATPPKERGRILVTYAPRDMWSRQKDTGKTMAELFATNGLPIVRSDNNRVQGHVIMRSMLEPIPLKDQFLIKHFGGPDKAPKELPALMFFSNVGQVIEDIQSIQHDDKNPSDCAKEPHDITHTIDGLRYFCINRTLESMMPALQEEEEDYENKETYEDFLMGGEVTEEYLTL